MRTGFPYVIFIITIVLSSCHGRDDFLSVPESAAGWKPVYFDTSEGFGDSIYSTAPRKVQVTGKIYVYQQYLFVGESGKGVHVFDNTDPSVPKPFAFINIPYNFDIAIRDTVMYADTYVGLVAISIKDFPSIRLLSIIRNTYLIPPIPEQGGGLAWWDDRVDPVYFECIDPSRGIVVGWVRATLSKPKCHQ